VEVRGHGGGVNLAGGGLGRSVHGEVASARGGEVAGEAHRCDRWRRRVLCARGEVEELMSYNNLT
jgi:hypothetical protein